jgi:hypothetical protein
MISFATTSSGFWSSPWALTLVAVSSRAINAPRETADAMNLHDV